MPRPWNFDADRERQKQEVKERLIRARARAPRTPLKSQARSSCTSETTPRANETPRNERTKTQIKAEACPQCRRTFTNSSNFVNSTEVNDKKVSVVSICKRPKADVLSEVNPASLKRDGEIRNLNQTYSCDISFGKTVQNSSKIKENRRKGLQSSPKSVNPTVPDIAKPKSRPRLENVVCESAAGQNVDPLSTEHCLCLPAIGFDSPDECVRTEDIRKETVEKASLIGNDYLAKMNNTEQSLWKPSGLESRPRIVLDECTLSSDESPIVTLSANALTNIKVITVDNVHTTETKNPLSARLRRSRGQHLAPDVKLILLEMGLRSASNEDRTSGEWHQSDPEKEQTTILKENVQ